MTIIKYAIKTRDKFLQFKWDYYNDWEDVLKVDSFNYKVFDDVLFDTEREALDKLAYTSLSVKKYGQLDDLVLDDLGDIKVVKIELTVWYKEL